MSHLSESDRARARHHLGYTGVEPASAILLGYPSTSQPQFLLESSMSRLLPETVPLVLRDLQILDCIEGQMVDSFRRLKAQQLGDLKLRNSNEEPTEHDLLERTYAYWRDRLADDLGVVPNPYGRRPHGGAPMNIPVAFEG